LIIKSLYFDLRYVLNFSAFIAALLFGQHLGTRNKNTTGIAIKTISKTIITAATAPPEPELYFCSVYDGVTFGISVPVVMFELF